LAQQTPITPQRRRLHQLAGRGMLRCPVTPPQRGTAARPLWRWSLRSTPFGFGDFSPSLPVLRKRQYPHHTLAALTALLPVRRHCCVARPCEKTWLRRLPCDQTLLLGLPCRATLLCGLPRDQTLLLGMPCRATLLLGMPCEQTLLLGMPCYQTLLLGMPYRATLLCGMPGRCYLASLACFPCRFKYAGRFAKTKATRLQPTPIGIPSIGMVRPAVRFQRTVPASPAAKPAKKERLVTRKSINAATRGTKIIGAQKL